MGMETTAEWKFHKGRAAAEKLLFPAVLLIYPLLLIHQGIDISDTTYSLGYYRFMGEMDITWVLATYLANVAGAFLLKLPMGDTLLGMNFYTGLLAAATALICYYALSRWLPSWIVFLGELTALSLCWCPTTILYNYLTYFFFAAGSVFLCKALLDEKDIYLLPAGLCLGLNVMVRFPNLVEAALIVAVWYAGWLRREKALTVVKRTGLCLAGYLAGLGSVLFVIMLRYGGGAFTGMIENLFGMTGEASDYTLLGMISATVSAYAAALRWMAYMVPCMAAGIAMSAVPGRRFGRGQHTFNKVKKLIYCGGILVLLRFYLGRGMFSLRYYNEGCVFQWMMLFLILTMLCCVAGLAGFVSGEKNVRILSVVILVILLVTPLGSNNYTYQNMNNMFLLAPYTLWMCRKIWNKTGKNSIHFSWQAFAALILLMTFVQSIGFGCNYVFRDGIYGEERAYTVDNSPVLKGMYTSRENAESLTGLVDFCQKNGVGDQPLLFWGDAPGLSYILGTPSAIFTTWPEIPSNSYAQLDKAIGELDWNPDIILHNEPGRDIVEGEKTDLILDYIEEYHYTCIYENSCYKIYRR